MSREYVDLGLSVKWATMNIGADTLTDPGTYFAWGETGNKDDYTWDAYQHGTSAEDITKYNYEDNKPSWILKTMPQPYSGVLSGIYQPKLSGKSCVTVKTATGSGPA